MLAFPRVLWLIVTVAGIITIILAGLLSHETSISSLGGRLRTSFVKEKSRQFHLLVPATASNLNLCKLLLSAAVTGFPDPILLGWYGHGLYNGAESHLFKISETSAYLNSLPIERDEDLVLLLDGYDVWLQLRPDVLITRYQKVVEKTNNRLLDEGVLNIEAGGAPVRNTIIFSPDKTCWPEDPRRTACWIVPESSMPSDCFGPDTDGWVVPNRARWLNSGTIMGPVKDMRDLLNGAMSMLQRTFHEEYEFRTSDQFYFQEVWAEQVYSRMLLRDGSVDAPMFDVEGEEHQVPGVIPTIPPGTRTEFHIAMDYDSDLFQSAAYYTEFITWMAFNHGTRAPQTKSQQALSHPRIDQLTLNADIATSPPPFPRGVADNVLPYNLGWQDLMLGTNVIAQQTFPVWHVTGVKQYLETWWHRMWWHPYGEALLKASKQISGKTKDSLDVIATVAGVRYTGAKMQWNATEASQADSEYDQGYLGGAWSDQGEWLDWKGLCEEHEDLLFLRGS